MAGSPLVYHYTQRDVFSAVALTSLASYGVSWLGHNVKELNFLSLPDESALGFGYIAKSVAILITPEVGRLIKNKHLNHIISNGLGGVVAYGVFQMTATPISLPTGIVLTVISIATTYIFSPHLHGKIIDGESVEKGWFKEKAPGEYVLHGSGTRKFSGGEVQKGFFIDGVLNGYAKVRYQTGDRYKGYIKDTVRHGKGVYKFVDGNRLEADFEDDLNSKGKAKWTYWDEKSEVGTYTAGKFVPDNGGPQVMSPNSKTRKK